MTFTDLPASPNGGIPDYIVQDPIGALLLIIEHWQAGALGLAVATCLFLCASVVLRLRSVLPALGTDRGGAIVAMVLGLCTAVGGTLYAGADMSIAVVLAGVLAAVSAVGSRQWARRLLWPADGSGTPWLDWAWLRWLLGQRDMIASIVATTTTGTEVVHATVYGQWAVHKCIGYEQYWTVTHVPSGICIPRGLHRSAAEALALFLSHDSRTSAATVEDVAAIKTVYDEICDGFENAAVMMGPTKE